MSDAAEPVSSSSATSQWRELAVSLLLAIVPLSVMMLLPATSVYELPENLLAGLILGSLLWLLLYTSAAIATVLGTFRRPDGSPRTFFGALIVLFLTILALAGGAALAGVPLPGLLTLVGWGLPLSAFYLARVRSGQLARGFEWLAGAGALGVLALFLLGPIEPRPAQIVLGRPLQDDLVILSWNLGTGPPGGQPARDDDLEAVKDTIVRQQADVVALQEVRGQAQLDKLLALLGPPWRGQVSRELDGATAIVTRLPGRFAPWNSALWFGGPMALKLTGAHGRLEILSVQFPPEHHSAARLQYADYLRGTAQQRTDPVLIAGDLNMDPENFWERWSLLFTDNPERDRQAIARLAHGALDAGRADKDSDDHSGAATAFLSRRLDYVFVPLAWECVEYQVLHGEKVGRMDHQPIRVRVRPAELRLASARPRIAPARGAGAARRW